MLKAEIAIPLLVYFMIGILCTFSFADFSEFETYTEWFVSIITWPLWAIGKIVRGIYNDVSTAIRIYTRKWRNWRN